MCVCLERRNVNSPKASLINSALSQHDDFPGALHIHVLSIRFWKAENSPAESGVQKEGKRDMK